MKQFSSINAKILTVYFHAFCLSAIFTAPIATGHESHAHGVHDDSIVKDWLFRPQYMLPQRAAHSIDDAEEVVNPKHSEFSRDSLPLKLFGQSPTERLPGLVESSEFPRTAFTFEAWINSHVNLPVGFATIVSDPNAPARLSWVFAHHTLGGETVRTVAQLPSQGQQEPTVLAWNHKTGGYKEHWWHVVLTYDGQEAKLFVNGDQKVVAKAKLSTELRDPQFEIAGYFANEPHMQLANFLQAARLHKRPLSAKEIGERFSELQQQVDEGLVYPGRFHFTVRPYLNYATQRSINVLWETSSASRAKIEWGKTADMGQSAPLPDAKRIQEFTINGLEPHTPYFYRVTATEESGEEITSGVLTFQTAVREDEAFKFAVIGDTETRPHINHALSKQIWGERPNFVVNLGDLTDGGEKDKKHQWNLEYFAGLSGLASRVPFFPVPGNGESDLYWYKRYHSLPGDESPYSFRYGNAEFFMLDSNQKKTEFCPGGRQYKWLEDRLQSSTAIWKFVCFHHAPYTSEEDDYGNSWTAISTQGDSEVRPIVPLFEKYQVDMVMFGHLHSYERSRPVKMNKVDKEGVVYLLAGGGGGNLEDFAPNPVSFSGKTYRGHHYCMVDIDGGELELRMHDLGGDIRDIFRLQKHKPRLDNGVELKHEE